MRNKSLVKELMRNLKIRKREAVALIGQNILKDESADKIIEDMNYISMSVIQNASKKYVKPKYSNKSENSDNKIVYSLVGKEYYDKFFSYLKNMSEVHNSIEVDLLSNCIQSLAVRKIYERLNGKIEDYRKFVNELPNKDIYNLAKTFNLGDNVIKYIAKNGNEKDFHDYMTSTILRNDDSVEAVNTCSKELSDKIFNNLKAELEKNGSVYFNKEELLNSLGYIDNCKKIAEADKEQIKDLCIKSLLDGRNVHEQSRFLKSKLTSGEEVKEYYQNFMNDRGYSYLINKEGEYSDKVYDSMIEELEKGGLDLSAKEVMKIISKCGEFDMEFDDYYGINEDVFKTKNRFFKDKRFYETYYGSRLEEILSKLEENEKAKAEKINEELAKKGIGELRLTKDGKYMIDNNEVELCSDNLEYDKINDIGIGKKCKYYYDGIIIDNYVDMTSEQRREFNNKNKANNINKRTICKDINGEQIIDNVTDFEVDNERYHLGNFGLDKNFRYSVFWKEQNDKEYPDEAVGILDTQEEINEDSLISFIAQNPQRFSQLYNNNKSRINSDGKYNCIDYRELFNEIISMKPESKLLKSKMKNDEEILENLVSCVETKKMLVQKEKQAKELMREYEEFAKNNKEDRKVEDEHNAR